MHVFYDDVSNTVTQGKSQWEMEAVMLHKLYDNVTSESDSCWLEQILKNLFKTNYAFPLRPQNVKMLDIILFNIYSF